MDGTSEPLLPSSVDTEVLEQPLNVQSAIYRAPDKAVRYLTGDAAVRLGSFTVQARSCNTQTGAPELLDYASPFIFLLGAASAGVGHQGKPCVAGHYRQADAEPEHCAHTGRQQPEH